MHLTIAVLFLGDRFKLFNEKELDDLSEEFLDYQLSPAETLPDTTSLDRFWGEMGEMKEIFTSKLRYPKLTKLAKCCLVIPVANADSERMFSMMGKVCTEFRSELQNDTVCALLTTKQNNIPPCYDFEPNTDILNDAKQACVLYNQSLTSESNKK